MTSSSAPPQAALTPAPALTSPEIVVDLDAIEHNVRRLASISRQGRGRKGPQTMVVVKADGYGHGMAPVARAARAAGADWLGVATPTEAVELREAGDRGPLLCWLAPPGQDWRPALQRGVEVTASSVTQLAEIVTAARGLGRRASVQLKIDTGLSRNGATPGEWPDLVAAAARAAREDSVRVTGIWSHPACADEPGHPATGKQLRVLLEAVQVAEHAGITGVLRHLANSAGAIYHPDARLDLVRLGIAAYGLTPAPQVDSSAELGLRPAMTLRAPLARVKRIPAGAGVSYGLTFVTEQERTVGLVPLGYGDGIPRHASNAAEVGVAGTRRPLLGRVCMDQFVIDLSNLRARPGEVVTLFGPGDDGEPTAQDWAEVAGTISYEIVTRTRGRMARRYRGRRAS